MKKIHFLLILSFFITLSPSIESMTLSQQVSKSLEPVGRLYANHKKKLLAAVGFITAASLLHYFLSSLSANGMPSAGSNVQSPTINLIGLGGRGGDDPTDGSKGSNFSITEGKSEYKMSDRGIEFKNQMEELLLSLKEDDKDWQNIYEIIKKIVKNLYNNHSYLPENFSKLLKDKKESVPFLVYSVKKIVERYGCEMLQQDLKSLFPELQPVKINFNIKDLITFIKNEKIKVKNDKIHFKHEKGLFGFLDLMDVLFIQWENINKKEVFFDTNSDYNDNRKLIITQLLLRALQRKHIYTLKNLIKVYKNDDVYVEYLLRFIPDLFISENSLISKRQGSNYVIAYELNGHTRLYIELVSFFKNKIQNLPTNVQARVNKYINLIVLLTKGSNIKEVVLCNLPKEILKNISNFL